MATAIPNPRSASSIMEERRENELCFGVKKRQIMSSCCPVSGSFLSKDAAFNTFASKSGTICKLCVSDLIVSNSLTIVNNSSSSSSSPTVFALFRDSAGVVVANDTLAGTSTIPFQTLLTNGFTAASPGVFIVPVDGGYEINVHVGSANYAFSSAFLRLLVNGLSYPATSSVLYGQDASNGNTALNATMGMMLAAGDTVSLLFYPSTNLPPGAPVTPNVFDISVTIRQVV